MAKRKSIHKRYPRTLGSLFFGLFILVVLLVGEVVHRLFGDPPEWLGYTLLGALVVWRVCASWRDDRRRAR